MPEGKAGKHPRVTLTANSSSFGFGKVRFKGGDKH